jgi:hypothetical protein
MDEQTLRKDKGDRVKGTGDRRQETGERRQETGGRREYEDAFINYRYTSLINRIRIHM